MTGGLKKFDSHLAIEHIVFVLHSAWLKRKAFSPAQYLHSGHDSNMSVRYRVDTGALLLLISYFFSRRGEWPPKVVIMLQQDLVMTATCQCGDHVDTGVLSSDQNTSISRRCPLQISSNDIGNPARK